jgi:5-methylcytosine-specific restriction endonuclease McrA
MLITDKIYRKFVAYGNPTKEQMLFLGEKWPQVKGWKKRLLRLDITKESLDALIAMDKVKNFNLGVDLGKKIKASDIYSGTHVKSKVSAYSIPKKKAQYKSKKNVSYSKTTDVASVDFLQTYEWRKLRLEALIKYGAVCQCCGASPKTGAVMNVDHIKPRKLFPALALDLNNLQVLCHECNHGKGNWNQTDWR